MTNDNENFLARAADAAKALGLDPADARAEAEKAQHEMLAGILGKAISDFERSLGYEPGTLRVLAIFDLADETATVDGVMAVGIPGPDAAVRMMAGAIHSLSGGGGLRGLSLLDDDGAPKGHDG